MRSLPLAALALAATTPAASAATVQPLKACYVSAGSSASERENVVLRGEGFTPEASVEILRDGLLVQPARTGSRGGFAALVAAPPRPSGERSFAIVVRDPREPAGAITRVAQVAHLAVTMRPRRAVPSRRVRLR